ncbi:MAG: gamma-glutamyltransferase [Steroidobacteraceae bacterium]
MQMHSCALAVACALMTGPAWAAAPPAVESDAGMVVSAQHDASEAGAAVLRQGGNAIDAAVAVGYALAVTHPCCGNIGGGGFMVVHLADGRSTFINFRERAPLAATANMYLDAHGNPIADKSINGYLSVGTPGTVLGLETARQEYGTMSRQALIAPAIHLAEQGFTLTQGDVDVFAEGNGAFRRQPNVSAIFLHDSEPLRVGDLLVQKDLGRTLHAISAGGTDAFYHGAIAATVAAASKANGGILTAEDFAGYTVTESEPITCSYRGYQVLSAPPPSSGGVTLCEMLSILEGYPMHDYGYHSSESLHALTEAMRYAYHDRNNFLGDPAFVSNPIERLLSAQHIRDIRAQIRPRRAGDSAHLPLVPAAQERAETTHYSVADRAGNAVSVTFTINDSFGAKVIAGDTGFFLNDEMDDFTAKPGSPNLFGLVQGEANAIAPGKRPLSSMTPTILLKDGRPVLVVGTPGGSRIITTVLQVIVNVIDNGMTLQEAIDAPRIHHQWLPDTLAGEPFAMSADTAGALRRMGYHLAPLEVWGAGNSVEAIGIAPTDPAQAAMLQFPRPGRFYGASDPRAPAGSAAAP